MVETLTESSKQGGETEGVVDGEEGPEFEEEYD